ncbi:MAG TPA: GxGYxYP family putative glycoside hydrolase, partial [Armatimonadota bacterium]|nr:GxGYxYP family putative glycoside hydrolase [Armatimonadota bacterium]
MAWALLCMVSGCVSAAGIGDFRADYGLDAARDVRQALALQPDEVLLCDLSVDLDEQIPQLAAQGLLNRDEPTVWIDQTPVGWGHGEATWQTYYPETHGLEFTRIESLPEFLKRVMPAVNGLVLYDQSGVTDQTTLALNLANLNACLPVSRRVYARYRDAFGDAPVIAEAPRDAFSRREIYEWLIAEALPLTDLSAVFSVRVLAGAHPHGSNQSLDYAFYRRCLIFALADSDDISQEGAELADAILSRLDRPAHVFGWGDGEFHFCKRLSLRGHTWCASVAAPNLSFHASVPPLRPPPYTQDTTPSVATPEKKVYLAFVSNEGDTTTALTQLYYRGWDQPARGKVPLSWATNPAYVELFPASVECYFRTKTELDYFVCAPSGPGYFYPQYMPLPYLRDVLAETARLFEEGINLTELELWQGESRTSLEAYADMLPGLRGLTLEHDILPNMRVGSRSVPILGHGEKQQYWITRDEFAERSEVNVEGVIEYLDGLYDPDQLPMFLPFYGFNESIPNGILELSRALDPEKYEIVDLGTLMHLASQVEPADPPPARPVNQRWTPELVRELAAWSDVMNGAIVSVTDDGLRIEIGEGTTWA